MSADIRIEPLTKEAFEPFGNVLDASGAPDIMINDGLCGRYHDRAQLEFGEQGRAGISIFDAAPRSLPYRLDLMERHPSGSQTFLPMTAHPFLVIVAPDVGDRPGRPRAFLTSPYQGVNFLVGTWHGVLTPLHAPGLFAVVDRIGAGANLDEWRMYAPYIINQ